ncbi:F-box/kelch-repeat protein At3g06240-like [Juglans microcarpa x Juglans regia]|uniref:F-box/kelch-repeat protein At3g06240-like n=1 Tax=Juglans microcarpa x Juglans regia TaxID=2249226 RepID=UPI001B7E51C8|nr:F-box/kelch-repeat protein At3g06240-like [Juglans microcarpa x Juglans regia]
MGVSIDFHRHTIDISHRSNVDKEFNFPFGSLIMKLALKAKIPFRDNEPTMKMVGSISVVTVVKSEAMLTKKRPHTIESTSSPPESLSPSPSHGERDGFRCEVDTPSLPDDKKQDLNTLLWNPATKETKVVPVSNLPGLPANYRASPNGIGFGFDAKTHNYKIIRNFRFFERYPNLDEYEMGLVDENEMGVMFYSEVYSLRTDSWTQVDSLPFSIWTAWGGMKTNLNGIGNWWASESDWEGILSFDIAKEVFLITPMPDDSLIYNGYRYDVEYFLLNELVAVAISWKNRHADGSPMCWDVWLLHKYGVRESWTKLFRVGPLTGICRPLEFWRNDIIFLEKDGELALYDVSTKEMMTILQIDGDQVFSFQVISYMESLVSISGLIN